MRWKGSQNIIDFSCQLNYHHKGSNSIYRWFDPEYHYRFLMFYVNFIFRVSILCFFEKGFTFVFPEEFCIFFMIDRTREKLCSKRLSWILLGLTLWLLGKLFNTFSLSVRTGVIYCAWLRVLGSYPGEG